ncbi:DUF4236 domain-containing protein [Pseudomonas helleri]|uniref:DUF4236 domain-containing protein n=1 Tax=Pseudomonas helleri TaxID=1608996 RepID=UPI003F986910
MRFQKRIQILPWVWLNISKSGFSFSFGPKGLSVNVSKKGTKVTAGLPGTGLSASHLFPSKESLSAPLSSTGQPPQGYSALATSQDEWNDPLYLEAASFVVETRRSSISLLQRKFKIGYARAASLIDQMEVDGIVTAMSPSGSREVLAPSNSSAEMPALEITRGLASDYSGEVYFLKAPLALTTSKLNIALHGAVSITQKTYSGPVQGEWLLVGDKSKIRLEGSEESKLETYTAGEFEESEVGRLPPGATDYRTFVFIIREAFEQNLAVPDKIAAVIAACDQIEREGYERHCQYLDFYGGSAGVVNRLLPPVIDLLPISGAAKVSLKNSGFRTIRDFTQGDDEQLLQLPGFSKGALTKARAFARKSGIPLDAERAERELYVDA